MTKSATCHSRPAFGRQSYVNLAAVSCLLLGSVSCTPTPSDGQAQSRNGGSSNSGSGGQVLGGNGGATSSGGTGGGGSGSESTGGNGGASTGGSGGRTSGGTGGVSGGGSSGEGSGGGGASSGGSSGNGSGAKDAGGDAAGGASGGLDTGAGAVGPSAYKVFIGQTHAHSDLSHKSHEFPGAEGPDVGFKKAKAAGADWFFISDHVDHGPISPADFDTIQKAAEAATDATFVALPAIEFHLSSNEANSFNIELDSDHISQANKLTALQYAAYLKKKYPGSFMQWTHPNRGPHPLTGRTPELDETVALLEVLNDLSVDIADDDYNKALDNGWHIGPAAGHDTHGEKWFGNDYMMGILATSLTKESVLDALRKSRCFASLDKKIRVWYDVNGAIMGDTTPMAAAYKATVKIEGSTASRVQIISKGAKSVAMAAQANGVWTADLTGVTAGSYYYALITSSGDKRTWTAPVWVE
jgi:hypothetical protein